MARHQLSAIDGPLVEFQHAVCTALAARNTVYGRINPLNAELNPICYLLALLELTIFSTLAG